MCLFDFKTTGNDEKGKQVVVSGQIQLLQF